MVLEMQGEPVLRSSGSTEEMGLSCLCGQRRLMDMERSLSGPAVLPQEVLAFGRGGIGAALPQAESRGLFPANCPAGLLVSCWEGRDRMLMACLQTH